MKTTYIIFKRFTQNISDKKEWRFIIFSMKIDDSQFIGTIDKFIQNSKRESSIYNVYILKDVGLDKIAYINKGYLYTL